MSDQSITNYIERKAEEFETILQNKDWDKVQEFYIEMEGEGGGDFVPTISHMMTDEDVREYRKWDLVTNGDTETQML